MDYSKITANLDKLLGNLDLSNTTEEGVKTKLPDGYYLCQVNKAELTESKSAGNPMVAIEYLTIEDGKKLIVDDAGYSQLIDAKGTANKRIFVNYVLSNEMNAGFFVSDMLKFQDPETNEPIFKDEEYYFKSAQGIIKVCDMLTEGGIIYIMVQTIEKKDGSGEKEQKFKPISWKRARKLELI